MSIKTMTANEIAKELLSLSEAITELYEMTDDTEVSGFDIISKATGLAMDAEKLSLIAAEKDMYKTAIAALNIASKANRLISENR